MSLEKYYNEETKTLLLPYDFNEELKDLPVGVKIIIFNEELYNMLSKFNRPVDNLPHDITHLTFGFYFNKPVNSLPPNLRVITFGDDFNHPVDNLPPNLEVITFGKEFNHSVNNLPKNIKELAFPADSFIKNYIPAHITNIKILFNYYDDFDEIVDEIVDNLPIHIKQIRVNNKSKIHYLKKIPFGCKIIDEYNNELPYENN